MFASSALVFILAVVLHMTLAAPAPESEANVQHFNVTTTAAKNGKSIIQCWQLSAPITVSSQPGTQGSLAAFLGDTANITYSVIPAGTNGGAHTAPTPQYVIFVAGAATITTPNPYPQEAIAHGGKNGLLFAADTAALSSNGHVTIFTQETVLAQIPTKDGIVPPHKVLYDGGCVGPQLVM